MSRYITERMHASVRAHLDQYRYVRARQLCTALEGYVRAGLPGFDIGAAPTARDADAAIDWRLDSEPSGARLIVEVAVFWT